MDWTTLLEQLSTNIFHQRLLKNMFSLPETAPVHISHVSVPLCDS